MSFTTMKNEIHLKPGKLYHIYNCGINGTDLFKRKEDYERFLNLFERFISPVCETYAWVLMGNHFHVLVRIKENIIYKYSKSDFSNDKEKFNEVKWETVELNADSSPSAKLSGLIGKSSCQRPTQEDLAALTIKVPQPHLHFSHLFNAYAKYFNLKYKRHGSLFERQFKRKLVDNKRYFRSLIIYIHQNPVHHGFCQHVLDYAWSSYLTCITLKPTKLNRIAVNGWFDNLADFKQMHSNKIEIERLEEWLGL
jgi:putative transposase